MNAGRTVVMLTISNGKPVESFKLGRKEGRKAATIKAVTISNNVKTSNQLAKPSYVKDRKRKEPQKASIEFSIPMDVIARDITSNYEECERNINR